jgi:hypothetical protein
MFLTGSTDKVKTYLIKGCTHASIALILKKPLRYVRLLEQG